MEMQRSSTFHLDFSTFWESVSHMETYLRRRRKDPVCTPSVPRSPAERNNVKEETKRPATHPTAAMAIKRPRFSNIEKMMSNPDIPEVRFGGQSFPAKISRENTPSSDIPNYDLPRLRPVHVEAREIPLPTHIKEMTIFSYVGNGSRRSKIAQHLSRKNYSDDEDDNMYHCSSRLPHLEFPTTDYKKKPKTRELSTQRARILLNTRRASQVRTSWNSALRQRQSEYNPAESANNYRKERTLGQNAEDTCHRNKGFAQEKPTLRRNFAHPRRSSTVPTSVHYVGDVQIHRDFSESIVLVAKQQPIHSLVKSK